MNLAQARERHALARQVLDELRDEEDVAATRHGELIERALELGTYSDDGEGVWGNDRDVDAAYQHLLRVTKDREAAEAVEASTSEEVDRIVSEIEKDLLKQLNDDGVHWERRFHTSLALGNGAALAALVSKALDRDAPLTALKLAYPAIVSFSLGLLAAGLIAFVLARSDDFFEYGVARENRRMRQRVAGLLAGASAGLFATGVTGGMVAVHLLLFSPAPKVVEPAKTTTPEISTPPMSPRDPQKQPQIPVAQAPPPEHPAKP